MSAYIPVLILMGVGITIAGAVMILTHALGPNAPNKIKMAVYECGVPASGDARRKFSVKFYLVAIIFFFLMWKPFSFTRLRSRFENSLP